MQITSCTRTIEFEFVSNSAPHSVPPAILEQQTSNDMVVREGSNVTLQCKAKGYPEPYVMWRREDGTEMLIAGEYGECTQKDYLIWSYMMTF